MSNKSLRKFIGQIVALQPRLPDGRPFPVRVTDVDLDNEEHVWFWATYI
jgi:hypothetical protein